MRETKFVTFRHLKVGQEIIEVKDGSSHSHFKGYVKSITPSYVEIAHWSADGPVEKYSTSVMFGVEMTEEELKRKYKDGAKEVLLVLQNKLHRDEIGYHEMWNAWLGACPYEIAKYCKDEKIRIVGCCSDITPKTSWSDVVLDIGVCAEYEDGERFWCHFCKEYIDDMCRDYPELAVSNE